MRCELKYAPKIIQAMEHVFEKRANPANIKLISVTHGDEVSTAVVEYKNQGELMMLGIKTGEAYKLLNSKEVQHEK